MGAAGCRWAALLRHHCACPLCMRLLVVRACAERLCGAQQGLRSAALPTATVGAQQCVRRGAARGCSSIGGALALPAPSRRQGPRPHARAHLDGPVLGLGLGALCAGSHGVAGHALQRAHDRGRGGGGMVGIGCRLRAEAWADVGLPIAGLRCLPAAWVHGAECCSAVQQHGRLEVVAEVVVGRAATPSRWARSVDGATHACAWHACSCWAWWWCAGGAVDGQTGGGGGPCLRVAHLAWAGRRGGSSGEHAAHGQHGSLRVRCAGCKPSYNPTCGVLRRPATTANAALRRWRCRLAREGGPL